MGGSPGTCLRKIDEAHLGSTITPTGSYIRRIASLTLPFGAAEDFACAFRLCLSAFLPLPAAAAAAVAATASRSRNRIPVEYTTLYALLVAGRRDPP